MEDSGEVQQIVHGLDEEIRAAAEADNRGEVVSLRYLASFPTPNRIGSISQRSYNMLPFDIMFKAVLKPIGSLSGQVGLMSYMEFRSSPPDPEDCSHLKTISLYNFLLDEYPAGVVMPGLQEGAENFDTFTGIRGLVDFLPLLAFLLGFPIEGEEEFLDFQTMDELLEHYRAFITQAGEIPFCQFLVGSYRSQDAPLLRSTAEQQGQITKIFKASEDEMLEKEAVDWFILNGEHEPERVPLTLTQAKSMFLSEDFDLERLGFGNTTFELLGGEDGRQEIRDKLDWLIEEYYHERLNNEEKIYFYLKQQLQSRLTKSQGDPEVKRLLKMTYKQVLLERLLYCSLKGEKPSLLTKSLGRKRINYHNLPRVGLERFIESRTAEVSTKIAQSRAESEEGQQTRVLGITFTAVFSTPEEAINEFREVYFPFIESMPIVSPTTFLMMEVPEECQPQDLVSYHLHITQRMGYLDYNDGYILEREEGGAMIFFSLVQEVGRNVSITNMNEIVDDELHQEGMYIIPHEMYYVYLDDVVNTSFSCVHIKKSEMVKHYGLMECPELKFIYSTQQALEGSFYRPRIQTQQIEPN